MDITLPRETPCPVFREWIEKSIAGLGRTPDGRSVAEETFTPIVDPPRAMLEAKPVAPSETKRERPRPLPELQPLAKAGRLPELKLVRAESAAQDVRTTTKPHKQRPLAKPPRMTGTDAVAAPLPVREESPRPPRFNEPQMLTHYKLPAHHPVPKRRPFNPLHQLARLLAAFR